MLSTDELHAFGASLPSLELELHVSGLMDWVSRLPKTSSSHQHSSTSSSVDWVQLMHFYLINTWGMRQQIPLYLWAYEHNPRIDITKQKTTALVFNTTLNLLLVLRII